MQGGERRLEVRPGLRPLPARQVLLCPFPGRGDGGAQSRPLRLSGTHHTGDAVQKDIEVHGPQLALRDLKFDGLRRKMEPGGQGGIRRGLVPGCPAAGKIGDGQGLCVLLKPARGRTADIDGGDVRQGRGDVGKADLTVQEHVIVNLLTAVVEPHQLRHTVAVEIHLQHIVGTVRQQPGHTGIIQHVVVVSGIGRAPGGDDAETVLPQNIGEGSHVVALCVAALFPAESQQFIAPADGPVFHTGGGTVFPEADHFQAVRQGFVTQDLPHGIHGDSVRLHVRPGFIGFHLRQGDGQHSHGLILRGRPGGIRRCIRGIQNGSRQRGATRQQHKRKENRRPSAHKNPSSFCYVNKKEEGFRYKAGKKR